VGVGESEQDGERAEYTRNMEIPPLRTNEGSVGRDPRIEIPAIPDDVR